MRPIPKADHDRVTLSALYALSQELNQSLDLDQVMHSVLAWACEHCNAQQAALVLLDDQALPMRWITNNHEIALDVAHIELVLAEGWPPQAFEQHHVLLIDDNHGSEPMPSLLTGPARAVVPLFSEHKPLGVIVVAHSQPAAFSEQQVAVLAAAAVPMGQALANARQFTQLAESQRSREEGEFMLIHDLRSPLVAASASLEIIKRAMKLGPTEPSVRDMIDESLEAGTRSLRVVLDLSNNMLDTRRLQIGRHTIEYQSVGLTPLYDEVTSILRSVAEQKHIHLRAQVTPQTLHVMGDMQMLRRMLINLTSNALRYTPQEGTVSLKAYQLANNGDIILAVEDTGVGIDPSDRERIFRPFEQGKGERRGIGLGLTICREVASAHGGRIWVENRQEGGSRFSAQLPARPPAS